MAGGKKEATKKGTPNPKKKFSKKGSKEVLAKMGETPVKKNKVLPSVTTYKVDGNLSAIYSIGITQPDGSSIAAYTQPIEKEYKDVNSPVPKALKCQNIVTFKGEDNKPKPQAPKSPYFFKGLYSTNGDKESRSEEDYNEDTDAFIAGVNEIGANAEKYRFPFRVRKDRTIKCFTLDEVIMDADIIRIIMAEYGLDDAELAEFAGHDDLVAQYFADIERGAGVLRAHAQNHGAE